MTSVNYSIQDPHLRDILVSAAEKIEELLSTKQITLATQLKTETLIGLRIDTILEQTHENNPMIFKFTYMLDDVKFKTWIEEHDYLMDGFLFLTNIKGITFMIAGKAGNPAGEVDHMQTAFTIGDKNQYGDDISIRLLQKEVTFIVHRNPLSKKEWNVFLPDIVAAQSRSNEA